jgi:hypothetical protein
LPVEGDAFHCGITSAENEQFRRRLGRVCVVLDRSAVMREIKGTFETKWCDLTEAMEKLIVTDAVSRHGRFCIAAGAATGQDRGFAVVLVPVAAG